jgi:hypothetical protein
VAGASILFLAGNLTIVAVLVRAYTGDVDGPKKTEIVAAKKIGAKKRE